MDRVDHPRGGLPVLALLAFAGPLRAASPEPIAAPAPEESLLSEIGVTLSARTPWPQGLGGGYAPLIVEVRNEGELSRGFEIEALSASFGRDILVQGSGRAEVGEVARVELLLPVSAASANRFDVEIEVEGAEDPVLLTDLGTAIKPTNDLYSVIWIAPDGPEAPTDVELTERLSWANTALIQSNSRRRRGFLRNHWESRSETSGKNIQATFVAFEDLPSTVAMYSSLDAVIVDSTRGLPDAQMATLASYARLGGRLVIHGDQALDYALSDPSLAPWIEPRFEVIALGDSAGIYAMGLGSLVINGPENSLRMDPEKVVMLALQSRNTWHQTGSDGDSNPRSFFPSLKVLPSIPGLDDVPYRLYMGLLILFGVLLGPGCFGAAKKLGRPTWLLLLVPATAVVLTVGLVAAALLHQGLDVKTDGVTYAVLDQREHRSSSAEYRELFAGMSAGAGLRPGPGTVAILEEESERNRRDDPTRIEVTWDEGPRLGGDALPVRKACKHEILTDRAERGRLDVRRENGRFVVENGFEAAIEGLLLRDPSGGYHVHAESIPVGATAPLDALDQQSLRASIQKEWPSDFNLDPEGEIPLATYLATTERALFSDDCGVDVGTATGKHRVLGILAMGDEVWR